MNPKRTGNLMGLMMRDTGGTTLVEFGIVLVVFLFFIFALLDFGRMAFEYVWAQKATEMAARLAIVRPPACAGVPTSNTPGPNPNQPQYGTACRSAAGICAEPGPFTCQGAGTNATATEIWSDISPLLPPDATIANLSFSYASDPDLGFLGGPYEPMVTVNLQGLTFQFISPLQGLATLVGWVDPSVANGIPFPPMSVSLSGEDLAEGENG